MAFARKVYKSKLLKNPVAVFALRAVRTQWADPVTRTLAGCNNQVNRKGLRSQGVTP